MKKTIQPRILRTYQLITKGVAPQEGDAVALAAANTLQAIAIKPTAGLRLEHGTARVNPNLHELLKQASATAKAFSPRHPTMPAA